MGWCKTIRGASEKSMKICFWHEARPVLFQLLLSYYCNPKKLQIVELLWVTEFINAHMLPHVKHSLTTNSCSLSSALICDIKNSYCDFPSTFAVRWVDARKSFTPNKPWLSRYNSSTCKCRPENNRKKIYIKFILCIKRHKLSQQLKHLKPLLKWNIFNYLYKITINIEFAI